MPLDWITLGNGSNDILELAAAAVLAPRRSCIYAQHSFAVYALATQARGARAIVVPARALGHDLEAMAAAVEDDTALIYVANPNNPTGTYLTADAVEAFLQRVPSRVVVVLDEAYNEYLRPELRTDSVAWVRRFPNLLLSRTFSKAFGLAGLRVGYGIAQAPLTDLLNRVRQPFNVNAAAQAAAVAALGDEEFLARSYALNLSGMQQLTQGFEALGLEHVPSYGNFVLVKVGAAGRVYQELLSAASSSGRWPTTSCPSGCAYRSACPRRTSASSTRLPGAAGRGTPVKLALVGVGLIGGSFARAALAAGEVSEVSGFDADPTALKRALALGAITEAAASAQAAVEQADLVMLAVPVGAMRGVMRAIAPHLRADAVVTDVGSTKADVLAAARGELGSAFARFVPGHPIAGRETHGVQFSDPRLFEGKLFIATPVDETDGERGRARRAVVAESGLPRRTHGGGRARPRVCRRQPSAAPAGLRARGADRARGRCAAQAREGGRGVPRLHTHRGIEPDDVARRLYRQPRGAVRRTRRLSRAARGTAIRNRRGRCRCTRSGIQYRCRMPTQPCASA